MKNSIKCLIAISAFAFFIQESNAQEMQASGGLELAIPFVNYASFGVGISGGFEYPVWKQIAATGQIGLIMMFTGDGDPDASSSSNIAMGFFQVGGKYYFQEVQNGFYGHAQFGFHTGSQKSTYNEGTSFETTTRYNVGGGSWAVGGGYQMEKFDIGARINGIGNSRVALVSTSYSYQSFIYFGIRVAYLIPIGS